MDRAQILVRSLDDDLPFFGTPFAVLIDADDEDWGDAQAIQTIGQRLLIAGCRYFVCFGQRSECVHDRLDDILIENQLTGVTTTFHNDETREDVVNFLITCAANEMKGALIFVRNVSEWETYVRLRG